MSPALKMDCTLLWCCQWNQTSWLLKALPLIAFLHVPSRGDINTDNRDVALIKLFDRRGEWLSDSTLRLKREPKNAIKDQIKLCGDIVRAFRQGRDRGDWTVTGLRHQVQIVLILSLLWVVNCAFVAEKLQVARCHKTISSVISWATNREDSRTLDTKICLYKIVSCLGYRETSKLH